jgi:thiol-disulfide isomerase/thioredoxin
MGRKVRAVLLFAAGVLLLVGGQALAQEKETSPAGKETGVAEQVPLLAVGDAAPAFRLAEVSGGSYFYSRKGSGNPLLLAFFSVFCDPCRDELAILQRIQERYGGRVDVLAICLDGKILKSTVAGVAKQEGYSFRVLLDEVTDRKVFRVADGYRVTEMPTLYIVNRSGRIAFAGTGRVAEDILDKAVRDALAK